MSVSNSKILLAAKVGALMPRFDSLIYELKIIGLIQRPIRSFLGHVRCCCAKPHNSVEVFSASASLVLAEVGHLARAKRQDKRVRILRRSSPLLLC